MSLSVYRISVAGATPLGGTMRVCEVLDIDEEDYTYALKFPVMGNPRLEVDPNHCRICGLLVQWKEEDERKKEEG